MTRPLNLLLVPVLLMPLAVNASTWYVDASVLHSGDGLTWERAFKTIQQGIDAASHADTVVVAQGLYSESVRFFGKNITLTSMDPLNGGVIADTIISGSGRAVTFEGTEDESCTLSGFTITESGEAYGGAIASRLRPTHATIERNTITGSFAQMEGGAIAFCDGMIRRNIIVGNHANFAGAGLAYCHGVIENNIISENVAGLATVNAREGYGGGLYQCDGTIRNNIIVRNVVHDALGGPEPYHYPGQGAGLYGCDGIIDGNIVYGNHAYGEGGGLYNCDAVIRNCVIWGNTAWDENQLMGSTTPAYSCIEAWRWGGEGNISEDPRFVDPDGPDNDPRTYLDNDYRLRGDSPCIDVGFNSLDLPEFDIAGMPRIMYEGRSLTVDIGAYEFFYSGVQTGPGPHDATLVWSFVPDKTYSIFYTDDLLNWHIAIDNFPSLGNHTTSWTDDGSLTGLPPGLSPKRFYRLLENP